MSESTRSEAGDTVSSNLGDALLRPIAVTDHLAMPTMDVDPRTRCDLPARQSRTLPADLLSPYLHASAVAAAHGQGNGVHAGRRTWPIRSARGKPLPRWLADCLFALYGCRRRTVRAFVQAVLTSREGGEQLSSTLRRVFLEYHQVAVGLYSLGGCFVPGQMAPATRIGRYCFVERTVFTFTRNHPLDWRSVHSCFYNPDLQYVDRELLPRGALDVGHGVYIGHNAIVLPSVSRIGDGAFIGPGTVVHVNVPAYAVTTGNPCRIVGYRYPDNIIAHLHGSRWWERSLEELLDECGALQRPTEAEPVH